MRRLIQWNLITLDGYFDGEKNWELDWHHYFWGKELEAFSIEQLKSADMLLFGRITYEGMAAYWQTATGEVAEFMNRLPKVVFSRTLERAEWANTRLVKNDAMAEVHALKTQGNGNMFVFGSGDLCAQLAENGLFDEYRIALAPVILGKGKTLFGRGMSRLKLELIEARALSTGVVILRYRPGVG
jgi:dihydrofolate reductase